MSSLMLVSRRSFSSSGSLEIRVFRAMGAKNGVLLLSSLVFYGWGEPRYLPVMLVSILQGYIFGRLIERFRD